MQESKDFLELMFTFKIQKLNLDCMQDLARPVLIEKAVRRLLDIYSALQEASGCDLVGVAREVVAGNAYSPLPQQPPEAGGGERLIAFVGEWFVQTVLMDSANAGVSFSLSRCGSLLRGSP